MKTVQLISRSICWKWRRLRGWSIAQYPDFSYICWNAPVGTHLIAWAYLGYLTAEATIVRTVSSRKQSQVLDYTIIQEARILRLKWPDFSGCDNALRRSDERSVIRWTVSRRASFLSGGQLLRPERSSSGTRVQTSFQEPWTRELDQRILLSIVSSFYFQKSL